MRVARYAASSEAIYAMFSGGGASFAEAELKAGRIALAAAPPYARPDLTGLSCRFSPVASRNGVILSLLVLPAGGPPSEAFQRIATEIVHMVQAEAREGHPLPPEGPEFGIDMRALRFEASAAQRGAGHRAATLARVLAEQVVGGYLSRSGHKLGRLDVRRYRTWVTRNSDFRKFDDGLRMTVDCTPATANALESYLSAAEAEGAIRFGLHRQSAALVTCLVPSVLRDDHLHFLDGAGGGYALAAQALKDKLPEAGPAGHAA
jgi:hypothetical protein